MQKRSSLIVMEIVTALLFLIFLIPFFIVLINAGKDSFTVTQSPLSLPENWGMILRNMATIWTSPNVQYSSSFVASVLVTAFSLFFLILLSAQAGWALVRAKTRISQLLFLLFVAARVVPFQIVMFPLITWFRAVFDVTGVRLLRSYLGMILAYVGFGMSLSIFLYHGFIKAVPYELEEAATIDGAHKHQVFYLIIFPILRPIHATVLVLNGIWIWNDYLLPLLVLGKGNRIQTIPLAVANFAGAFVKQWDLILTAILMAMIPIIVFFLAAQKSIVKGMIAGSVKG